MAFWGIQVKPGYPFSLKFDDGISRRLRISQATLAIGSSKKTSLVQCNVGNKSPVLLCALLPDKAESLQLNLEFDEHEEVLFSVIGPRAVHLTGFYAGNPCDDNSESYGVDIANSENEESVAQTDEDEYEDSFINDDDDLEVLPPSPVSNDGAVDIVKKRSKKKNARKRLKKKSQVVESDDKSLTWEILPECIRSGVVSDDKRIRKRSQVVESDDESNSGKLNDGSCIKSSVFVSDSEDGIPILSVRKSKKAANNIVSESIACGIASNPKADGSIRNDDPKRTMPKKKSKDAANERKNFEADSANIINEGDEVKESEEKTSHIAFGQDLIVIDDIDDDPGMNTTVPKNKVKGTSNEEKLFEADAADHSNPHDKAKTRNLKTRDIVVYRDPIVGNNETRFLPGSLLPTVVEGSDKPKKKRKREQEEKTPAENDLVVPERKADENTSKKAARKKKQKSKVKDENLDVAVLLNGGKENFKNEVLEENVFSGSSQVRALSNGLVIEELEASKSEGKAAAPRRKLKVQYLAKLKENGEIIGSNGKAPYRFRLGDEDVMEGWNIGLDGMHAGDKRRLTVPPSLGNWSGGSVENIPPDSWVIYDVELLSVR